MYKKKKSKAQMKALKDVRKRTKKFGMTSFVERIQNRSYVGCPTKQYKGIRNTTLISELLGAGSDPL